MNIYIGVLLVISLYAFFLKYSITSFEKYKILLLFFSCLVLWIVAAFRNESVGADHLNYRETFLWVLHIPWEELSDIGVLSGFIKMEYGYLVFNKLLTYISKNTQIITIVSSAFIIVGFGRYIYRYSKIPWLSIFLLICMGYYTQSLNVIRQYMAIVIVLNSIKYIEERRFWRFLMVVVIASFFHKTACFFLPVYPIARLKLDRKFLFWAVAGMIFLSTLGNFVLMKLAELGGFAGYIIKNVQGEGKGMLIFLALIVVGAFLIQKKTEREEPVMDLFYHIVFMALIFQVLGLQFNMLGRLLLYYSINIIIFIPNVLATIKSKDVRLMAACSVCGFALFFFYVFCLKNDTSAVLPYVFYWE